MISSTPMHAEGADMHTKTIKKRSTACKVQFHVTPQNQISIAAGSVTIEGTTSPSELSTTDGAWRFHASTHECTWQKKKRKRRKRFRMSRDLAKRMMQMKKIKDQAQVADQVKSLKAKLPQATKKPQPSHKQPQPAVRRAASTAATQVHRQNRMTEC